MINGNEVKQLAGSLVNQPPDGWPQDPGEASSYGFPGKMLFALWGRWRRGTANSGTVRGESCLHLSQPFQGGTLTSTHLPLVAPV